ncbi:MAG: 30S ribosomal protein S2 [Gemmatimonadaceae bacterium]|nr:30S ribosomal protein S2 [Gemmatimonadaceae bacterium]
MPQPTLESLLAAGVHFGHQTRRWNPKMRRFIFAERNGIHIIDLQKTVRQLELAQQLVREVVMRGEQVLFVCTKQQLSSLVKEQAERSGSYYITERWLGGLLTNFATVKRQLRRLQELEAGVETGTFEQYTKKEQLLLGRQREKLSKNLEGIKIMRRLPGLMFVVDSKKERIAVSEANKLGIPIVAICDTNSDPDLITVPIAGNDDAIRSVELITGAIADAIAEARKEAPARAEVDDTEATVYSSDRGSESADDDRRRGGGGGGRGGQGGGRGGPGGGRGGQGGGGRPRRRANPAAIAARLKNDAPADGGSAAE